MTIDVTSLSNRRATERWNRVAVGDILERLTWSVPDQVGFIGWEGAYAYPEHQRVTYAEADRIANRVANALLAAGLSNKARVLLVCENSVEAYLTKLGIAKAGLVIAPINPSLAADVIEELIKRTEPSLTIIDAEVWPKLAPIFERVGVKVAVTIPLGGDAVPGSRSFADFIAPAADTEPEVEIHGDDIVELQFTSGTTAMPKAVMFSHVNTYMAASGFALSMSRGLRCEADMRLCSFLPLIYHIGGQVFALPALLCGGTLVIGRRSNPDAIVQAISREGVTALWSGSPTMVGTLAESLLKHRGAFDTTSLKVIVYGWGAISPGTLATLRERCGEDFVALEIFGQTESVACHRFWPHKWEEIFRRHCPETNYVGIPSPLLASQVMDANGGSLHGQPGVVGEAVYRSPVVMQGYYKDEAGTRAAFAHGWFHSGDSCVYDDQGLRIMVDRSKDIVKTGGENVSSQRVEAVLALHPHVARVAIVGLPDARWGEAITAAIILRPTDTPPTEAALIAYARERLAGFETPKKIVFVESYPETVGGKIMKHVLRVQLAKMG